MDDPSVEWSQARFNHIVTDLGLFLVKTCKFAPSDIIYIPISGYQGTNIMIPLPEDHWFKGPTFLGALD
jgi:translation elongation factor EF-1alpha